jgi:hypothetical protein
MSAADTHTKKRRLLYSREECDEVPKGRPVIDNRSLIEGSNAASETRATTTPKEEMT